MQLKQRILQLLQQIGLSESEAIFLVAANRKEDQTINDVQRESGLSRTSTYRSYESLLSQGLIQVSNHKWRKTISSVPLAKVAEKIGKAQRKLRKAELELRELSCLDLFSQTEDPIEIITDQDKINEKYLSILSDNWENLLCYGSIERLLDIFGQEIEMNFIRQRCNKGKKGFGVLTERGEFTNFLLPRCQEEFRSIKFAKQDPDNSYVTYLFGNEINIWSLDPELGKKGVIIRDPIIVKSYFNMFDKIWQKA
ncbi:MAG: helix-turn-helix domain-containing protein [Candidatus Gracilibacteria bacterium]|nr:helix-turn-helix domain-containing protein [Candidatus Gracilibacteria bacterium]